MQGMDDEATWWGRGRGRIHRRRQRRRRRGGGRRGRGRQQRGIVQVCVYAPLHPDPEAAAASSDLELAIPFAFGGKETVATAFGYTKPTFTVFNQGGASTDKEVTELGAARYFLGRKG